MTIRVALTDFALKNTYYAGASLAVYEVNANLQQTATLATLYADPTGPTLRPNPMVLDSEGKFPTVLYVEKPVILVVTPVAGTPQALGVQGLIGRWRGVWLTGTLYYPGERVRDPAGPTTYVVLAGHTSATFATDVAANLLQEEIDGDSIAAAAAAGLFGSVLPSTPAEGYYRINPGATGVEARTAAQVRGDIGAFAAAGGDITGSVDMTGTGYFRVPSGLTAQRPGTAVAGMIRWNTETSRAEIYDGTDWQDLPYRSTQSWETFYNEPIAAVASIDITWATNAYAALRVQILGAKPAVAGAAVDLIMRFRSGGTWHAGASDYDNAFLNVAGSVVAGVNATQDGVRITGSGNNGLRNVFSDISINIGGATQRTNACYLSNYVSNASGRVHRTGGTSLVPDTNSVDGVRFLFGGTNFLAEGRIVVEGFVA